MQNLIPEFIDRKLFDSVQTIEPKLEYVNGIYFHITENFLSIIRHNGIDDYGKLVIVSRKDRFAVLKAIEQNPNKFLEIAQEKLWEAFHVKESFSEQEFTRITQAITKDVNEIALYNPEILREWEERNENPEDNEHYSLN